MGLWILVIGLIVVGAFWYLRRRAKPSPHSDPTSHRVSSQYRGVSIKPCPGACLEAWELADQHLLSSEAPSLPLEGCDHLRCTCRYQYLEDRRDPQDRRGPMTSVQRDFIQSTHLPERKGRDRRRNFLAPQ